MGQVLSINNDIYILGEQNFEPKEIFENGQMFRWTEDQGTYTIIVRHYVARVKKMSGKEIAQLNQTHSLQIPGDTPVIRLENVGSMEDYHTFWHRYFDLDRDYKALIGDLSTIDAHLRDATAFAPGLRVLKQDLFEMIISFIISANNNISRIKNSVARLCALAGDEISAFGARYHQFPAPETLAALDAEALAKLTGVGYRAPYIIKTAAMIANNEVSLEKIRSLPYEDAHKEIMRLPGVGPKVADCILLFGDSREMAFPVDTWVLKVMNAYYLGNEKNSKKIKAFGQEYFGSKAGLAQQYLFYHARERSVGEKQPLSKA